jgi:hypothetical protein
MKDLIAHESIHNEGTIHWLTPPNILEKLGQFDFDPCACPEPRPWPTAKKHISLPDDGLKIEWEGRVWLNPPYGNTKIFSEFMNKMAKHNNGIALVFARTDTRWFENLVAPHACGLLFLIPRLSFYQPNGELYPNKAGGPSVLVAYGEDNARNIKKSELRGCFCKIVRD